jgi:hypothetical protein
MRHRQAPDPVDALKADSGALERLLPLEHLYVPKEIRTDNGWLLVKGMTETATVEPGPGLLIDFARIHSGMQGEAGVLAYAKRWGALYLCGAHGLPMMHTVNTGDPGGNSDYCWPLSKGRAPSAWLMEPIPRWFQIAAQVATMLSLGIALREDREPSGTDWALLGISDTWAKAPRARLVEQRGRFVDYINEWTAVGKIRPSLRWENGGRMRVELIGAGLYAALGLQLMAAIGDSDHIASCDACRSFFKPASRAPKRGQLSFCPACRRSGAANRASVRASRAR